ncbi:hypothetical protein [uncultured Sphingomonas sp.]|uniref:hypothetical protein n=1 Tax=uncultured Sphingomonas sp. TaxID=158754 RepID=UPI0025F87F3D|nr:hypothetical protein [uncultured Sphingomonas sp.]
MTRILAAALAAVLLTCAPAAAQLDTRTIAQAQPLTGTERMPAVQGSGCTAKTTPCASVAITPSLISTFLAPVFQPLDADLTAIAALTTADFGRQLLTRADAASTRTALGLGSIATQSAGSVAITGGSVVGLTTLRTNGRATIDEGGNFELMANQIFPGDVYLQSGFAGRIEFNAGGAGAWNFQTAPSGSAGSAVTQTTRLQITASSTRPGADAAYTSGEASLRWSATYSARYCYSATVCDYAGSGTPLNVVVAGIGSTFRRTDGGTSTTFYVKESGAGASTGWVAK